MNKYLTIIIIALCFSCDSDTQLVLMDDSKFETEINGNNTQLFTLRNTQGMTAQITNYGGKIVSLWVPDKNGKYRDVVLGFDSIDQYVTAKEKYFGALIGRYGNRIANGTFALNDSIYKLAINNGKNHLHGGTKGYNDVVWIPKERTSSKLVLTYTSVDGEEGYPGNLNIEVIYKLTPQNELSIEYKATTDKSTPVNLTSHSFFNLNGAGNGSINNHFLQIRASNFTPINNDLIPTGKIIPVQDSPFDFREEKSIGKDLNMNSEQLKFGKGYDHNFVLDGKGLRNVATAVGDKSGIKMNVMTDEPGMQFYGGNFLDGRSRGKYNLHYGFQSAFCLETQHFPDSPNQPNFPSTILNPDATYKQICIYKFSIEQ